MSRWHPHLEEGEIIHWEGRPAPRAFTFRNWRWSVGTLALAGTALAGLAAIDLPIGGVWAAILCLLGIWGTVGHLLYARLAWEEEFYALTDRRLLVRSGFFCRGVSAFDQQDLKRVSVRSIGLSLATILVEWRGGGRPARLFCLEYPEHLVDRLLSPTGRRPVESGEDGQRNPGRTVKGK